MVATSRPGRPKADLRPPGFFGTSEILRQHFEGKSRLKVTYLFPIWPDTKVCVRFFGEGGGREKYREVSFMNV